MSVVLESMNPNPVVVFPHESVQKAASLMSTGNIGILCVTENGRLTGIVSERDLVVKVLAECSGPEALSQPVSCIMSHDPVTVSAYTALDECLQLFLEKGFRHLPVTDSKGTLIGVLSQRSFLPKLRGKLNKIFNSENYKLFLQELDELDRSGEEKHSLDARA